MTIGSEELKIAQLDHAEARWGRHPHGWPRPRRRKPRFWQFSDRAAERELSEVFGRITQDMRGRYYQQVAHGQLPHEDAGCYFERCYRAMIGLPPLWP